MLFEVRDCDVALTVSTVFLPASAAASIPLQFKCIFFVSGRYLPLFLPVFPYIRNPSLTTVSMSVHRSQPVSSSNVRVIGAKDALVVSPVHKVCLSGNYNQVENT